MAWMMGEGKRVNKNMHGWSANWYIDHNIHLDLETQRLAYDVHTEIQNTINSTFITSP